MNYLRLMLIFLILFPSLVPGSSTTQLDGKWTLIHEKSTKINLYGTLSLQIQTSNESVKIIQKWGGRRSHIDTIQLRTNGKIKKMRIKDRVFPSNVFMGLSRSVGKNRQLSAKWQKNGEILEVKEDYDLLGSQGTSHISVIHTYKFEPGQEVLCYQVSRSSRKTGPATKYFFKKAGTKNAFYMNLIDDWAIDGQLSTQAFLISLQGQANASGPQLYFIYPEKWDFRFTPDVFDFLKNERYYSFKQLRSPEQALNTFKDQVKGYVVWDKQVRTSLIVAFTLAGLENAVVVSEDLIPMAKKAGLKAIADFRGKFTGQTDIEIYTWAYNEYWERCSKEYIVWMGGEHGKIMKPGVADWGDL